MESSAVSLPNSNTEYFFDINISCQSKETYGARNSGDISLKRDLVERSFREIPSKIGTRKCCENHCVESGGYSFQCQKYNTGRGRADTDIESKNTSRECGGFAGTSYENSWNRMVCGCSALGCVK